MKKKLKEKFYNMVPILIVGIFIGILCLCFIAFGTEFSIFGA